MSFPFLLATPEQTLFSGEVNSITLRTTGGELAFLSGHVPFIGAVTPSECKIEVVDGSVRRAAVHGGFVEMGDEGAAVLAPAAELAEDIDLDRAREAESRAEAAAAGSEGDEEILAALERARVRLAVGSAR